MKKKLALFLATAMTFALVACGGGDSSSAGGNTGTPSEGGNAGTNDVQDVNLKVWVPEEELALMQQMVESFNEAHPEYNFTAELAVVGIDEANSLLKTDADSAADVFQVASGGISELTQKGLLLPIGYDEANVRALYDANAVAACEGSDGLLYALPFSPNTFFMYYNSSMFTEDDVNSLETMLAKELEDVTCNVAFPVSGSWYIESFFFAAGCTLFGADGTDPSDVDWNNEKGLAAGQYLLDLVRNPAFMDDKDGMGMSLLRDGKVGAIFTGTWDAKNVQEALGENYAAAKLPTITINGAECQLRNFGDYKTYAVKSSTAYPLAAQQFAEWICNEENQRLRYVDQGVTPSVVSLSSDSMLNDDPASAALMEQAKYYYAQPSIPQMNDYWTPATALGEGIVTGEITEANLQAQLDAFVDAVTSTLVE